MPRDIGEVGTAIIKYLREGGTLANDIIAKMDKRLEKLLVEVNKQILSGESRATTERYIRRTIRDMESQAEEAIVVGSLVIAKRETRAIASSVASHANVKVRDIKKPTVTDTFVKAQLKKPMHTANYSVADGLKALGVNMSRSTVNVLRRAHETGEGVEDIANQFIAGSKTINRRGLRKNMNTVVRTAVNQVANSVRMETYKRNKQIDRVLYVAILDSRTSNFCAVHDGRVYDVDGDKPSLPAHFNCRSTYMPILVNENAQDAKDQLSRAKSKTGKFVSYEGWLKTQTAEQQKEILGSKAFAAFSRTGKLNTALNVAVV